MNRKEATLKERGQESEKENYPSRRLIKLRVLTCTCADASVAPSRLTSDIRYENPHAMGIFC